MNVIDTALPDVKVIEPRVFGDDRGFFIETWNARTFSEHGIHETFVQDNHSRSSRGVLRGIHYQMERPQGKLVRVTTGAVYDVTVDLRRSSPTFGKWAGVELSAKNFQMLWVPPGFGHGFLTLEDGTDFIYKCTDFYAPALERCVAWNDPELNIDWPLGDIAPILSAKDAQGTPLGAAECYA
ncbi:MAG: dTDP-4-dehydrorhamnose 3,5-epimerase [Pseudomonadota bacterium]